MPLSPKYEPYGKNYDSLPRFGKSPKPFFITLEKNSGPGKYVGTLLHVAWPHKEHLVGGRGLAILDR